MGTFHRALRGVYHDDLKDNVALGQSLFAGQSKLARMQQGLFNGLNGAADGRLAQAIGLADVGRSGRCGLGCDTRASTSASLRAGLADNAWPGVRLWANAVLTPGTLPETCPAARRSAA